MNDPKSVRWMVSFCHSDSENRKRTPRDQRSLEQIIQDSFKGVPQEEWDKLPHDLTNRLDYYLYGAER